MLLGRWPLELTLPAAEIEGRCIGRSSVSVSSLSFAAAAAAADECVSDLKEATKIGALIRSPARRRTRFRKASGADQVNVFLCLLKYASAGFVRVDKRKILC